MDATERALTDGAGWADAKWTLKWGQQVLSFASDVLVCIFTGCAMHANVFDFSQMLSKSDKPYLEFLRVPSLSVGIYVLEAGATDNQTPHHEDEVYYVAGGRAKMQTEVDGVEKSFEVDPGTIIFIPARMNHCFTDIIQRLDVLVFFASAAASSAGAS